MNIPSPVTIPLDPSLYHVASSSMPPSSYQYHVQFQNAAAVSPPSSTTAAATTPTASTALFSSQPLPIMQPPGSVTLQSLQQGQAHSQQQQSNMNTNPLFQLMHSQSQLQQQQHQQHLQQQQQQQQLQLQQQQHQQQSYQPEASTSTHNNTGSMGGGGGGYIGTPLIDSSGPASPVDDSSLSARDRRASKKGTKRPRPTLSCTECVRRKSKCDRVIPCSTCIKRGSPDKCKVDDEADRPSQPFAQARELEAVKDRVQKLEQLLYMLAPVQARALGLESHHHHHQYTDSDNGSAIGASGGGLASASPTNLSFPSNATLLPGSLQLGGGITAGGSNSNSSNNPFMLSMQSLNANMKQQKRKQAGAVKQQQQDSDSELDEDEEGEDGREAEKAAFALESIAVAGRPSALDTETNLPMTSQARAMESQLRQREVDFLMSMLPDWTLSRSLVDAFFAKVAWQNHVIHIPTFEAQYTAMKELVDQHRISEIDPAWLSLYFMVLACGLFHSPGRPDMPAAHQAEYTHTWVIGAQRALQLADWSGKPSLTCIQSVVLLPIVLMHAGGIKRLASWIAAALRMAQLLDLHKLDDGHSNSAQDASGLAVGPGGKGGANGTNGTRRVTAASTLTSVEKEIGKRLYFSLTHGEVNFASRWLGLGSSSDAHNHIIPTLLNVDDADLLANTPVPKPIEVPTASSFQVIRARITMQDFNARLTGSDARAHKYETVLAFDQRTKELLDQLPAYFKYDRSDDPDIKAIVQQRPYIAYQRCVILYGLNNRLLRAHRPFMSRGYQDAKYAYSTESCIKAAKVIIAAQRALRDIFDAADRMYNCLLYCFSSAVVLLVDNFHRLAANSPISDTSDIDAQRHEALDVLHMLRRESNMSTIAASGARVLEGLLNEEGQRRTQIGLPPAGEDFSRNTTPDTDHSSLREVVGRIASVSNSSKPVISPSSDTTNVPVNALSDPQHNVFAAAPMPAQPLPIKPPAQFAFSASAGQPSSTNMGGTLDSSLSLPSTQTFLGSALGDSMLGGDDSEDLLRSLGFFEVTGNSLSSVGQGGSSDFNSNFFGGSGDNNMTNDLGWLDGLGDW